VQRFGPRTYITCLRYFLQRPRGDPDRDGAFGIFPEQEKRYFRWGGEFIFFSGNTGG
jgi:hypothetical protein